MKRQYLFVFGLLLAVLALAFGALPTHAATLTVNTTNDSGSGSLRQAIVDANPGDTITFNLTYPATITLTSGHLEISKTLTIDGPGASNLAISGDNLSRVISISVGVTFSISSITIANGKITGDFGSGGGINNLGTLNVADSSFSGNSSYARGTFGGGGGIYNEGTASVTGSRFSSNYSSGMGGGILNYNGGTLTVTNCIFINNINDPLGAGGGGIKSYWGGVVLSVSNSIFSGNSAGSGGGISNSNILSVTDSIFTNNSAYSSDFAAQPSGGGIQTSGTTMIRGSTFTGNSASKIGNYGSSYGGGIASASYLDVINSTISGNSVSSTGTVVLFDGAFGGGISNSGTLQVTNSTLSGNSAYSASGTPAYPGIFTPNYGGPPTFVNTIVANSIGGSNCIGSIALNSTNNLATDNTCGSSFTQVTPAQLALAPLTGSPAYFPLYKWSVAIDAGTNTGCLATDQRGVARPQDGDGNGTAICDIGSYEAVFGEIIYRRLYLPLILR